jgi:hypothetical protein
VRAFVLCALAFSCGVPKTTAANATEIGIIQYNTKDGQGGWTSGGDVLGYQLALIAGKIKTDRVDFIALEQAGQQTKISDALDQKYNLQGWKTIISVCGYEHTQLAYSSEWEVTKELSSESLYPYCWSNGRPYNIVYFKNKSNFSLLFVIAHFPHCHIGLMQPCTSQSKWDSAEIAKFKNNVRLVAGDDVDLKTLPLVVAGDMNELGAAEIRHYSSRFLATSGTSTSARSCSRAATIHIGRILSIAL